MNWLSANYKWLFDGIGAAVVALFVGLVLRRLQRSNHEAPKQETQGLVKATDSSIINSPVASGNTQIRIGHAQNVHLVPNPPRSAVATPTQIQRPKPNIKLVDARAVFLVHGTSGFFENRYTQEKNALVIVLANEPEPEMVPAMAHVKAVLIYKDGDDELCDVTGAWVGSTIELERFEPDGIRHRLIGAIRKGGPLVALGLKAHYTEFGDTGFVIEDHPLRNVRSANLLVRLISMNSQSVLFERQFTLTIEPLGITQAFEPIA
ncbi:MAG: hypothetical protein ACYDDI_06675 [Candidatus Acidiferrales bacterium]